MIKRRTNKRGPYPAYIQFAAAGVILLRELTSISRAAMPWLRRKAKHDHLIPLTYRHEGGHFDEPADLDRKQQFWSELIKAADTSPVEQIAKARPVRRLVRLFDGEVVELKLAHRSGQAPDQGQELTAFFRFEDSSGPIGFAAIEQHGEQALLHSVFLLAHRRGAGAGSDLVEQVMAAAAAMGIDRVWLLTGTAAPFFAKLGFESTVRRKLPKNIGKSAAIQQVPDSATCMVIDLSVAGSALPDLVER